MKFVNAKDHPAIIRRAVERDDYDGPKVSEWPDRIGMTTLTGPARIAALKHLHDEILTVDVDDCLYMLMGRAVHKVLEEGAGPNDVVEMRLETPINGSIVSGKFDHLDDGTLRDWKNTGSKWQPSWEWQLNGLDYLCSVHRIDVARLEICAFRGSTIERIPVNRWDHARQADYLASRVAAHREAAASLPRCTLEETWGGRRCKQWCVLSKNGLCEQYLSLDTGKKRV